MQGMKGKGKTGSLKRKILFDTFAIAGSLAGYYLVALTFYNEVTQGIAIFIEPNATILWAEVFLLAICFICFLVFCSFWVKSTKQLILERRMRK